MGNSGVRPQTPYYNQQPSNKIREGTPYAKKEESHQRRSQTPYYNQQPSNKIREGTPYQREESHQRRSQTPYYNQQPSNKIRTDTPHPKRDKTPLVFSSKLQQKQTVKELTKFFEELNKGGGGKYKKSKRVVKKANKKMI
jgi:hypothetical protein